MKRVLAHGTFDIIHYGHIEYLKKAKSYGDYLIVMITSDELAVIKKGNKPFFDENIRKKVIASLKYVDKVIIRNEKISSQLIKKYKADVFVTIYPKYKILKNVCNVKIVKETKGISTTAIKKYLSK